MVAPPKVLLRNSQRHDPSPPEWVNHLPLAAGSFSIVVGLLVLVAWYAQWTVVIEVFPGLPPMKFNTALAFVAVGAALILLGKRPVLACLLAVIPILIGAATLLEYLTTRNFGLDEFFIRDYIGHATVFAGRMSPLAASSFTFLGISLITASLGRRSKISLTAASLLACIVSTIALVAIFGYAFGIDVATGWGYYTRLALHTAVVFLLLGLGLLVWAKQFAERIQFNFLRWLPVTASVTLIAMIAIISSVTFAHLSRTNYWQKHSFEVIEVAQNLLGNLTDTQRGMRGYVLSSRPEALNLYQGAVDDIPNQLERLQTLTDDNPDQQARLQDLSRAVDDVVAYSIRLLNARENRGIVGAVEVESEGEGLAVMDQARAKLSAFTAHERRLLDERTEEVDTDFENTKRLVVLGSILAGLLLLFANFMASREVAFRRRAEARSQALSSQQQAILNSANHAIISTNVDGIITSFNQTAEQWFGYSAAELIGKVTPAIFHIPEEVVARSQELSRELGRRIEPGFDTFVLKVQPGKSEERAWTFVRKDGSRFPVWLSISLISDETGKALGYLGVVADLTERKKMETALEKNRQLLDGILSSSLDGILAYETIRDDHGRVKDFRFTLVNPAAEKLSRTSAASLIGRTLLDKFPNVVQDGLFEKFVKIVELGKTIEFEYCSTRTDPPRWYRVTGSKLGDGLSVSYMEITERRQAEETLRLSEERLRLMIDGVKDYALILLTPEGIVANWNAGAERLKGYKADEIIGQNFSCFYLPEARKEQVPERILRLASKEGRYEEEGWLVRKDGTRFLAHVVVTAIRDSDGRLLGYAKITRDITETRKFDKALRDQAQILDLANDTIFVRDADDKITYWNHGAQRVYGWTKEEVLGRVSHSLLQTKFPIPLEDIRSRLHTLGHWEGELQHVRRDGTIITVLSRWALQPDEDGRPPRIIEMNYDITERKKTEDILRISEERFSSAFQHATTGMALVSLDGRWMKVNPAICDALGYTEEELSHKTFQDITHPDDLEIDLANVQKLIRGELDHYKMEKRYFHKDGHIVWAILGVSLLRDEHDNPLYFISQIEDISEMKQAMIRQLDLTAKAQAAERAKSEFLANMSHELRTPLNGIIGFSEILSDGIAGEVNPEQKEYLGDILNSGQHLLQLINDVLDLAKVEAGKMELHPEAFHLAKAIEQVCSVAYPLIQKKKIKLLTVPAADVDEVFLDQQKLKQVLYNLLSNAVKFTDERGSVTITVAPKGPDHFTLAVTDTGIGIKPENIKRLFTDFEQLDEGPMRRYQGTGLGLALTRKIVEMQSGTIAVASEFGKGTVFTVTLPRVYQEVSS